MVTDRKEEMEHGAHETLSDCSRRISALEQTLNGLQSAIGDRITKSDADRANLVGVVATERERASGYEFRIAALEGIKPLGISTLLSTSAAVLGLVVVVGGGYLNQGEKLNLARVEILQKEIESNRRDFIYIDNVMNRNEDRQLKRMDDVRREMGASINKLSAVEAKQELILRTLERGYKE